MGGENIRHSRCNYVCTILQIQQLLVLMESSTIKESIDTLIRARPCVSTSGSLPSSSDLSSLTSSLDNLGNKENKRLSMKRKSVALPSTKCNCGKCSKCVPSPSGKY